MADAIREAVRAYANDVVTARILQRALHLGQELEVPEGGARLRRFVELHLRAAMRFVLGDEAAEQAIATLAPMVGRIPTEVPGTLTDRASRPQPAPVGGDLGKPLPVGQVRPMILLASLDPARIREVEAGFRGEALVCVVQDVVALLDAFANPPRVPPLIVVDCGDPAVQPATIATMAAEMPRNSQVVLWGGSAEALDDMSALVDEPEDWHTCGTATKELSELIDAVKVRLTPA